jgi:hypothetical protein
MPVMGITANQLIFSLSAISGLPLTEFMNIAPIFAGYLSRLQSILIGNHSKSGVSVLLVISLTECQACLKYTKKFMIRKIHQTLPVSARETFYFNEMKYIKRKKGNHCFPFFSYKLFKDRFP